MSRCFGGYSALVVDGFSEAGECFVAVDIGHVFGCGHGGGILKDKKLFMMITLFLCMLKIESYTVKSTLSVIA